MRGAPIACASLLIVLAAVSPARSQDEAGWRLFAVEYARSEGVREARLVRGASPGSRVDMSWYFFVAIGHGRVVLVDCGTDALARPGREALRQRWSIAHAVSVEQALGRLDLSPDDVTDVVLTHHHWDHVGGLPRFPRAAVHAHPGEWRRIPARLRRAVERDERLRAISEPAEPWPGLRIRESGRHTAHQLMVEVECESGSVIIAGDAAYLYRNVEEGLPVTVSASDEQNVADVARAAHAVGATNVLPGHDPALFSRYPHPSDGVAAICD